MKVRLAGECTRAHPSAVTPLSLDKKPRAILRLDTTLWGLIADREGSAQSTVRSDGKPRYFADCEGGLVDIATVLGLLAGFGLIISAIMMGGGISEFASFVDVPSVMITVGGSIAALFINYPMKTVFSTLGILKNCFFVKIPVASQVIRQFKDLAVVLRKDGMLALEKELEKIPDDFMKRGLEQVISGASEEQLQVVLETELSSIESRHTVGKQIIDSVGTAAPAFGMIGTLVGLVKMLQSLNDPSQIGGGMAVALLTTLYGAVIANVACIPLAGKLENRSKEEVLIRELMITGLLGLTRGLAPRALEEHLAAYLSPKNRKSLQQAQA